MWPEILTQDGGESGETRYFSHVPSMFEAQPRIPKELCQWGHGMCPEVICVHKGVDPPTDFPQKSSNIIIGERYSNEGRKLEPWGWSARIKLFVRFLRFLFRLLILTQEFVIVIVASQDDKATALNRPTLRSHVTQENQGIFYSS
jgi:hypothetical protein